MTVDEKFETYPDNIKPKLLRLRALILDVAAMTPGVGALEETLKWGEPSYLTSASGSGTTVRIDWKSSTPGHYYMYFNCKTSLIDNIKEIYGSLFNYSGNRSLIFDINKEPPWEALSDCVAMAFTYHLRKK
jgi:hypothetical protein